MKSLPLMLLVLVIAATATAQNPNLEFKRTLILYNLSTLQQTKSTFPASSFYSNVTTTTRFELLHPTVAFRWRTSKRNFQEVELTRLSLNGAGSYTEYIDDSTG